MIKVLIASEEKKITSIEVKGHSGSGPYGHDLVCAAVSAVVVGGANNLENKKGFSYQFDEGDAFIKAIQPVSSHDEIVLETIITSLRTIENSYGKFIQIKNL